MKKLLVQKKNGFEEQAMLIANEIFNLTNQYTNDSNISKFFLTDEIANSCYTLAGGFASVIYSPNLGPRKIKNTTILSFIYGLMTYGFNIYLKEHSLSTNAAPYSLSRNPKIIERIQQKTLSNTLRGKLMSSPLADKIIKILSDNIENKVKTEEFHIAGHRLSERKFLDYCKLSMYWGYNFAKELLIV